MKIIDAECDITLMPRNQCAHCKGVELVEKVDWTKATIDRWFTARYDGRGACGHEVKIGDYVAFTPDRDLLCEECAKL